MEFLRVEAGRFHMGSPHDESGRQIDETRHGVVLTTDFWLGRYEVTQEEWTQIMEGNPSRFRDCGPRCPVETVSSFEIERFIERLEELSPGNDFRLPTEAEWELACRAGTVTPFSTGSTMSVSQANFDGRYPYSDQPAEHWIGSPTPVGSYPANPWGFHDLHGNVWEWTQDWYALYPQGTVTDPLGPPSGELRVIRGGSWTFDGNSTRCALRYTHAPHLDGPSLGFRLVRVDPAASDRRAP